MTSLSISTHIQRISLLALSLVLSLTSIPTAFAAEDTSSKTPVSDVSDNEASVLDLKEAARPIRTQKVDVTNYTSAVDECDADPFITADGTDLEKRSHDDEEGVIATNFLLFGTKVRIPSLFGDKVFVVHDRMNKRYFYRIDIWVKDKKSDRQFGLHRNVTIEIVQMGDGKTQWAKRAEELRLARLQKLEKAKVEKQLADAKAK